MSSDDAFEQQRSSAWRARRCRRCKSAAADSPLLTVDSSNLCDWYFCEACWLPLEIGFSDARPYDDLYQYLAPLDGRLTHAEVYHNILRGRVLLDRRGGLVIPISRGSAVFGEIATPGGEPQLRHGQQRSV
jgi:hypothetical protein